MASIAAGFSYTEPKFGIDGEPPKRRKELLARSDRICELLTSNPELLTTELLQELPMGIRLNILEFLAMSFPYKIETPEDPLQSLDAEQQVFYEIFGQSANAMATCADSSNIPLYDKQVDFGTLLHSVSKIPKWAIRNQFESASSNGAVKSSVTAEPPTFKLNTGQIVRFGQDI